MNDGEFKLDEKDAAIIIRENGSIEGHFPEGSGRPTHIDPDENPAVYIAFCLMTMMGDTDLFAKCVELTHAKLEERAAEREE